MDGGMNPTLATRCQWRQQQPYWRIHPPGPFVVDSAPPTALAVLLSGDGGGLDAGSDAPEQDPASVLAEEADQNAVLPAVSAGPIEASPPAQGREGVVVAGPLAIRIPKGPSQGLAPGPRAAAAPQARVAADPSPGPLRLAIPAAPPEPVIAAEPAPGLVPFSYQLPLPSLAAPGHELALALELAVELSAAVPGQGAARAEVSQGLATPDWLGTLLWLVLVVIDAGLALAEVLQRLPAAPAKRDREAIQSRQGSRLPSLGRLRLRQPLGS